MKAYILLESLIALALLVMVTTVILGELSKDSQRIKDNIRQEQVLNVASMAVQTHQSELTVDGVTVSVKESTNSIRVFHEGEEVMSVAEK
ncbi:competence type IV pilus minor pilin ComGE [Streptococcus sp. CSL10205-OR2]|uniref:competence type IV pilus minor pilin ComGE n=1 Tax=Streptococcus sp. CSL10205-OR2 TaxID=2980558 RepID=UPI0021D8406D|nr:competence type IV pilus minor pilin ComGE [Streptococcus sp. CSL10205-OR2]MCU9534008.1 competence type IV pilus minor pilin ComGE [Streptococcus sp. CSL10205-OR2]